MAGSSERKAEVSTYLPSIKNDYESSGYSVLTNTTARGVDSSTFLEGSSCVNSNPSANSLGRSESGCISWSDDSILPNQIRISVVPVEPYKTQFK